MTLKIFLDDQRDAPGLDWKQFRKGLELLSFLKTTDQIIECISLDYDLGERDFTGADVAREIVKLVQSGHLPHFELMTHSSNSDGAAEIIRWKSIAEQSWAILATGEEFPNDEY